MERTIKFLVNFLCAVVCVVMVLLVAFMVKAASLELERADRNANFNVPDTVHVRDTVYIIAPTPASDMVVGHATTVLERADKRADTKLKSELKDELNCIFINEVSKVATDTNAVTKTAIGDSVAVIVPISEKVYDDSLYRAVVRGYQAELVSLDIYRKHTYYPVVVEKEYDPPNIVMTIGPYVGVGNKGFNYGISLNIGVPLSLKRKR